MKRQQQEISAIMRRVRSRDTTPEVLLRKALWAAGVRFRTCPENLPGKPDIVIHSKRMAIFIDGDFWHGGQWRRRRLASLDDQFRQTESRDYWLRKIRRNMDRDCRASAALLAEGWSVVRFWESEVLADVDQCVAKIVDSRPGGALSVAPGKTFAEFFGDIGLMGCALEKHGWTAASGARRIPAVTLAIASFPRGGQSLTIGFEEFIRLLKGMRKRPPLALLECAAGFLTWRGGRELERSLLELNRLGYSVDAIVLNAGRLFVMGRGNGGEESALQMSNARPPKLVEFIATHGEIRWSIRDLPAPPPPKVPMVEWIAENYLNPVINELIHAGVMRAERAASTDSRAGK